MGDTHGGMPPSAGESVEAGGSVDCGDTAVDAELDATAGVAAGQRSAHNSKYSVLEVFEILVEHTDGDHRLTAGEIAQLLQQRHGVARTTRTDRKVARAVATVRTVRNQLQWLAGRRFLGFTVEQRTEGQRTSYFTREIITAAVAHTMANALICSPVDAEETKDALRALHMLTSNAGMHRVCEPPYPLDRRPASDSPLLLGNELIIVQAIEQSRAIRFDYADFTGDGTLRPRTDALGRKREYFIDPYALVTKNGQQYLIGHFHQAELPAEHERDDVRGTRLETGTFLRCYVLSRICSITLSDEPIAIPMYAWNEYGTTRCHVPDETCDELVRKLDALRHAIVRQWQRAVHTNTALPMDLPNSVNLVDPMSTPSLPGVLNSTESLGESYRNLLSNLYWRLRAQDPLSRPFNPVAYVNERAHMVMGCPTTNVLRVTERMLTRVFDSFGNPQVSPCATPARCAQPHRQARWYAVTVNVPQQDTLWWLLENAGTGQVQPFNDALIAAFKKEIRAISAMGAPVRTAHTGTAATPVPGSANPVRAERGHALASAGDQQFHLPPSYGIR